MVTGPSPNPVVLVQWRGSNGGTGPVDSGYWYDQLYYATNAAMTDAQGRYELTQLPAGTYHLKAARGGYDKRTLRRFQLQPVVTFRYRLERRP